MAKIPGFACMMFSLAMMMLLTTGQAQTATMPITCPPNQQLTISAPGDYQIVPPGSHCFTIVIQASDINLDLNDSVISAAGTAGIVVKPEAGKDKVSNVSIFNGTVVGSQLGIQLLQADNCNVLRLRLISNDANIRLVDSNRNTIIDNIISASGTDAISFINSHNNNLSRNKVIDNGPFFSGGSAILLDGSNRNIIAFNDVLRNDKGGVVVGSGHASLENTILNNQISENGQAGIQVQSTSDGNTIVGNRVNDNGSVMNPANGGIYITSSKNLVAFNGVNRNRANAGIVIALDAAQNLILNNSARNNMNFDLADNNPNCDDNKWDFNTPMSTRNQNCIH
jgi:parallel beta-helix repeat protein